MAQEAKTKPAPIWWSNLAFFLGMHVLALVGVTWLSPAWQLERRTLSMCIASWQLATFGITVGYHRLWSHRAFTATLPLRIILAGMGCLGFQGSIKWWVLRHRLHHRFTDTDSDPYNAQKGLYHSHMGWIFRKPDYPLIKLIDRKDLEADPGKLLPPHRYYVPLTVGLGLVAPTLIGWTYGDAIGGYIWGGVVARLLIWHFTFFINSLAHYLGDQAYSLDVTARGNFVLALFTGGEANHNFHHAFPKDYRNGPRALDWDPSKWMIYTLHHLTPFVPKVYKTADYEVLKARAHVLDQRSSLALDNDELGSSSVLAKWSQWAMDGHQASQGEEDFDLMAQASATSSGSGGESDEALSSSTPTTSTTLVPSFNLFESSFKTKASKSRFNRTQTNPESTRLRTKRLPTWSTDELLKNIAAAKDNDTNSKERGLLVLVIDGYAVDASLYAREHPGGYALLRQYAIKTCAETSDNQNEPLWTKASEAFNGGLNKHGWSAREKMRELRVARIVH
ncbi:hypothetical protein OIV83_002646 [Microbotryomycetes sp. JL201]|nr:hypothetical protein OIV83_002646 [Microbotryomycetes sp. JL201]